MNLETKITIYKFTPQVFTLTLSQSVDYEKYYLYSLITHSTAIEGSTLTELIPSCFLMRG